LDLFCVEDFRMFFVKKYTFLYNKICKESNVLQVPLSSFSRHSLIY